MWFQHLEKLGGGQSKQIWGGQSRDIFRGGPVKKTTLYEVLKRQSGGLRLHCLVMRQQEYIEIQSRYTLFDCVHYPRQLKGWCIQKDSSGSQN